MEPLISKLQAGNNLDSSECAHAVELLLATDFDDRRKALFLKTLHQKGETAEEIAAFAKCLLSRAIDPGLDRSRMQGPLLDVCGTGGDGLNLFNISTTSMFVLAAAGAVIVKHGNRGITSKSGGADVLEALGIRIDLPPIELKNCIESIGIGFLFAPLYHPAFKLIAPVRKLLAQEGTTTIFNLLGPLLNPTQPDYQLVGVFNPDLLHTYSTVLQLLGRTRGWALNGAGADEILPLGITHIVETTDNSRKTHFQIDGRELGIPACSLLDLAGGDREANAQILLNILSGQERGPKRDTVLLNAAAGLVVCGLSDTLSKGLTTAEEMINSGRALAKLEQLRAFSSQ